MKSNCVICAEQATSRGNTAYDTALYNAASMFVAQQSKGGGGGGSGGGGGGGYVPTVIICSMKTGTKDIRRV